MTTLGGLLLSEQDDEEFDGFGFDEFDFVRYGDAAYKIDVPVLTAKEMSTLSQQLPATVAQLRSSYVPEKDLRQFARLYRYFPRYVDADV